MKKMAVFFFVIIAAGTAVLSGCAKKTDKKTQENPFETPAYTWGNISGETITIWGDRDDLARPYIIRLIERYEQLTGNTIRTTVLSKQDIDKKLPAVFASDTAEHPDILLSYGGSLIGNLNPEYNFYDFTNAQWKEDLTDTAINQAVYNGKIIGLPYGEASVSGILYNKDIFKKYKIDVPATQKEFLAACRKLLDNGIIPVYLPYAEITMLLYQFPMDSIVQDSGRLDAINNGTLSYADIPEMKKIVEWYKTMSDSGYFGKDYLKNDWNTMNAAMQNGKYAMMICWDTWLYTVFTGNPSKIGLMPAFMGIPENGSFEGANVSLFIVNKNSPRLNAALDFITFAADPYNYNVAYAGIYTAPIFNNQTGSISTPQYMENERLIERKFYNSTAWLRINGFSQIDAMYIQDYMQDKCTLDECLQNMDTARRKRAAESSRKLN